MKCLEKITNNFLTNFTAILIQMARVIKENKFQEKVTFILNDVAEIVLNWNLGHITNDDAIKKINSAFAKQDFFTS